MSRLVPNPLGDMLQPLQRVEAAIARLAGEIAPVGRIPDVHDELRDVNDNLRAILAELRELRGAG